MITLTCEGSGRAKVEELAVAGALVGVAGPALASPSSLKIWLAARIFRGMRCVVLRWDGRRDGGGAGVSDTGWIGRAASKFCRASATTSERGVSSNHKKNRRISLSTFWSHRDILSVRLSSPTLSARTVCRMAGKEESAIDSVVSLPFPYVIECAD